MPGIHHLAEDGLDGAYLRAIFDTVVLKDVVARGGIRDVELLQRLIAFLLANLGQTFSAKRISDYLKSQRRALGSETIYNYLRALADCSFAHRIQRYDLLGKRLLETQEKVFVADHGFAHALLGFHPEETPHLLENIVCVEALRRGYQVRIGRQGRAEVDFVCDRAGKRIYIQVAYLLPTAEAVDQEFAPLRAIRDNHRKVVLSMDELPPAAAGGIERLNIRDFLLAADW